VTASITQVIQADISVRERFEAKYRRQEGGCWIWQGKARGKDGYGQFKYAGRAYRAHRFSWLLYRADVESGLDVTHNCPAGPDRRCVNPDHLVVTTHRENIRRRHELQVVPPWKDGTAPTSPEMVMVWVEELLASYKYKGPYERLAIGSLQGAPWREYDDDFDHGFLDVNEKYAIVALYLYAVRMGVNPKVAAVRILKTSPITVQAWNKNPLWKEDIAAARSEGRRQRYRDLEDTIVDTLEARIPGAEIKDVVRALATVNRREAMQTQKSNQVVLPSGNTYVFKISVPEEMIPSAVEEIYSATVRDVTSEARALPPGGEDECVGADD
jgi:hypothetical protein